MDFSQFKTRFSICLDPQQEAAVQATEGPVLLLAVPGSGKTTVLVTRLGCMCYVRGIRPESILTMTYTVAAARDMERRFASCFGEEAAKRLSFRTINGVCSRISRYYERVTGRSAFRLLEDGGQKSALLGELYRSQTNEFATESTIKGLQTAITYVKNQMIRGEELSEIEVEGLDFAAEERYSFDGIYVEILPDPSEGAYGGASYSLGSIGLTEDGAVRMLLEFSGIFSTGNQINSGDYTLELRLRDLTLCRRAGERDEVIYEGEWSFSIPLTESMVPTIAIDSAVVELGTGGEAAEGTETASGVTFTLRDIRVTATGLSFYTTYSDDEAAERVQMAALSYLEAAVILSDGTEVLSSGSGGSRTEDGGWYCTSQWPAPIQVEDVAAIRIAGTEIAVP